jgi:hypothetical protein
MSELTYTSYYVRQGIKIGIIGLLSFFIVKTSYGIFRSYWRKAHPPAPPPPDTAFGKLPPVNFPRQSVDKPTNLVLETISGGLPEDLPTQTKVYFIPQKGGRFHSLNQATEMARSIGLGSEPRKITENTYKFTNTQNDTEMTINVLTQNFTYQYDYLNDQTLINPPDLPAKQEAIKQMQTFLSSVDKFSTEMENGEYTVTYWKVRGPRLMKAVAPVEADFMRINLSRPTANDYPIVEPQPPRALISGLFSGISRQGSNIVEVDFTYFPYDNEKYATYPLKTPQQAWEQVQQGDYYLASYLPEKGKQIKIRKISLAYFNPPTVTRFLQPVYLFQGDQDFKAYVSALPVEWVVE